MKKAIIIGASSGIGKGLAMLLAQNNYKVGITGRRTNLLEKIKESNPICFITKTFDITNTEKSIIQLNELASELESIDLIIFCSGTGDINNNLDFTIEKQTIDTNVLGFTNIINWSYNLFEKQGYGQLATISSIGGIRGSGMAPSYNASKAFQINYLEGLRQKSTKSKNPIIITDIRPGLVDTDMAKGENLFWLMPIEKVTKQIFYAINKKRKVAYVSKRWRLIAIILKILPRFIYSKL